MTPDKNIRDPEDLLAAIAVAAQADGTPPGELAAEAMLRCLAKRKLDEPGRYGREQTRKLNLDLGEAGAEAAVEQAIAESRRERSARP